MTRSNSRAEWQGQFDELKLKTGAIVDGQFRGAANA